MVSGRPGVALVRTGRDTRTLLGNLRGHFLTGLVIILPLVITVWMLGILFGIVHGVSTPFILRILRLLGLSLVDDAGFTTYLAPLIGVAATLLLILLVGLLTTNFLGRRIVREFDRLMLRIPLIKPIYGAARQLLDALNRKTDTFQRVVAVEYPRSEGYPYYPIPRDDTRALYRRYHALADHHLIDRGANLFFGDAKSASSIALRIAVDQQDASLGGSEARC